MTHHHNHNKNQEEQQQETKVPKQARYEKLKDEDLLEQLKQDAIAGIDCYYFSCRFIFHSACLFWDNIFDPGHRSPASKLPIEFFKHYFPKTVEEQKAKANLDGDTKTTT